MDDYLYSPSVQLLEKGQGRPDPPCYGATIEVPCFHQLSVFRNLLLKPSRKRLISHLRLVRNTSGELIDEACTSTRSEECARFTADRLSERLFAHLPRGTNRLLGSELDCSFNRCPEIRRCDSAKTSLPRNQVTAVRVPRHSESMLKEASAVGARNRAPHGRLSLLLSFL